MSLYMSPFQWDLPRTCPIQHYSVIAYRSDHVTGMRQPYGGVHISQDALCFWHLLSISWLLVRDSSNRALILNLNPSDDAFNYCIFPKFEFPSILSVAVSFIPPSNASFIQFFIFIIHIYSEHLSNVILHDSRLQSLPYNSYTYHHIWFPCS